MSLPNHRHGLGPLCFVLMGLWGARALSGLQLHPGSPWCDWRLHSESQVACRIIWPLLSGEAGLQESLGALTAVTCDTWFAAACSLKAILKAAVTWSWGDWICFWNKILWAGFQNCLASSVSLGQFCKLKLLQDGNLIPLPNLLLACLFNAFSNRESAKGLYCWTKSLTSIWKSKPLAVLNNEALHNRE